MSRAVLVTPGNHLESQCIVQALESAHIEATQTPCREMAATVGLALPRMLPDLDVLRDSKVPLLLVVATVDEEAFRMAEGLGASGLVGWRSSTNVLVEAVRTLLRGESRLPARGGEPGQDVLGALTDREREVVGLLCRGARNDEIADELGISYHTARTHVQNSLAKVGLSHRHALAALAARSAGNSQPEHAAHASVDIVGVPR